MNCRHSLSLFIVVVVFLLLLWVLVVQLEKNCAVSSVRMGVFFLPPIDSNAVGKEERKHWWKQWIERCKTKVHYSVIRTSLQHILGIHSRTPVRMHLMDKFFWGYGDIKYVSQHTMAPTAFLETWKHFQPNQYFVAPNDGMQKREN